MLQPEPRSSEVQPKLRSGEGCNTLLPEGLANVNALEKNVIVIVICN